MLLSYDGHVVVAAADDPDEDEDERSIDEDETHLPSSTAADAVSCPVSCRNNRCQYYRPTPSFCLFVTDN